MHGPDARLSFCLTFHTFALVYNAKLTFKRIKIPMFVEQNSEIFAASSTVCSETFLDKLSPLNGIGDR